MWCVCYLLFIKLSTVNKNEIILFYNLRLLLIEKYLCNVISNYTFLTIDKEIYFYIYIFFVFRRRLHSHAENVNLKVNQVNNSNRNNYKQTTSTFRRVLEQRLKIVWQVGKHNKLQPKRLQCKLGEVARSYFWRSSARVSAGVLSSNPTGEPDPVNFAG